MKNIMIDMDDVICTEGFIKLVNKFLNTNYNTEDANSYYVQDLIPEEKREDWIKFFANNNVYNEAILMPDAYEVIKKLNEKYEIYISTAYIFRDEEKNSGDLLKNKFNYLYENLPFINPNRYIFINNKNLLNCDIIIDDKISNLNGDVETKILFQAYHNKNIKIEELEDKKIIFARSWKDIEKILLK